MNLKQQLCDAFCGALSVREVPIGYAIGTEYEGIGDDRIGFYVERLEGSSRFRIIDDALFVPTLEAIGAEVTQNASRRAAFEALLKNYGVEYNKDTDELHTAPVSESNLPSAALNFLAFLLRAQDLAYMAVERAASTFKEDATARIKEALRGRAEIKEDSFVVHEKLKDFPADLGIQAEGEKPVALFFGVNEAKLYQAMLLETRALAEMIPCSVVGLLETDTSVPRKLINIAMNYLDATLIYKNEETSAVSRIAREAIGFDPSQRTH